MLEGQPVGIGVVVLVSYVGLDAVVFIFVFFEQSDNEEGIVPEIVHLSGVFAEGNAIVVELSFGDVADEADVLDIAH